MLIPVLGELLSSAGLILNVYFKDLPMEYAGLTEALFEGLKIILRFSHNSFKPLRYHGGLGNNVDGRFQLHRRHNI